MVKKKKMIDFPQKKITRWDDFPQSSQLQKGKKHNSNLHFFLITYMKNCFKPA